MIPFNYPLSSAALNEARIYAKESMPHTMNYRGWETQDQQQKFDRITVGKFGQIWVAEFCRVNEIPYESDKSSPKYADDLDLKIGGFAIDVKTSVRADLVGQVSPGVIDKPIDYFCFVLTNRACDSVCPIAFVYNEDFKRYAVKVSKGEFIPGTDLEQRFSCSYFLPIDAPVWVPFHEFMESKKDGGLPLVGQPLSPPILNQQDFDQYQQGDQNPFTLGANYRTLAVAVAGSDQNSQADPARQCC